MPIRPELRKFYGREWHTVTRPRILARAKNRCEQCGKRNHRHVWVTTYHQMPRRFPIQYWSAVKGSGQRWICSIDGAAIDHMVLRGKEWERVRRIRVVLTISHVNHVSGDDRDDNLKALCQWCHLNYDKWHHRETRAERKDRARPILLIHQEQIA